jgi:hypothetical protein
VVKLSIDYEFPSRTWWESGGQELWDAITEAFDPNRVVLDDALAESWLADARKIPGWDAGPEYAPHPVAAVTLADDDEELL